MKCQNVQIGDALAHSIEVAASERWPAFGAKSWIVTDWFRKKRISIPMINNGLYGVMFEPVGIPELPHNVQLDYNEANDILLIALRSGGANEAQQT